MMRKLLLAILFSTISILVFSQQIDFPIDSITNKIKFSEVVNVKNNSQSALYTKAREWFAKSFKSSESVLDMEDKENGKLIGKANFTVSSTEASNENEFVSIANFKPKKFREEVKKLMSAKQTISVGMIDFTISIYIKDDRYKYEISNLYHKGSTQIILDHTVTIPDGEDLSKDPVCGYNVMMPKIRWYNIRKNALFKTQELIEDLKRAMASKDKKDNF